MYYAKKSLKIGESYRAPGEAVPEAYEWDRKITYRYLQLGWLESRETPAPAPRGSRGSRAVQAGKMLEQKGAPAVVEEPVVVASETITPFVVEETDEDEAEPETEDAFE